MQQLVYRTMIITVLATGCVNRDDDDGLDAVEASYAGDALGTSVELAAASYGPVETGTAVTAANPCITITGDTSDLDGDSIPADAIRTFDCAGTVRGFPGSVTGTETIHDYQPSNPAWAFTATSDLALVVGRPLGTSTVALAGQTIANQRVAPSRFDLVRELEVVTVFAGDAGRTTTVEETSDWTATFAPEVAWTPGATIVTGALTVTGAWHVTVERGAADATLATPTPLTLDPACPSGITAGTLVATYQTARATRALTVTWSGCGQRSVSHD